MNHLGAFELGTLDIHSQSPAILVVAGARRFRAPPNCSKELPQFRGYRELGLRSQASGLGPRASGLGPRASGLRPPATVR